MTGRFKGKVAIVTGAASGIGKATVARLAAQGATVVATDIRPLHELENRQASASLDYVCLDVSDRDAWHLLAEQVRDRYGQLDVLINCAGILREGTIESTDYSDWRQVMAINLDGVFWGCQACLPLLIEGDSGAIVNISSVSGIKADSELVAYDVSKGAVRLLSKEIALYCASRNYRVRCNSVHPGIVQTPMVSDYLTETELANPSDWVQPNGKMIAPAEVAGMIAWLASDEASFVTGAEYIIDGGMTA